MNTRTLRMFSSMLVAIVLMFAGDVVWNFFDDTTSAVETTTYAISLTQASSIAHDTEPHAVIAGDATLTSYQGTVAYAVPMNVGMIYVEADTGRILANTTVEVVGVGTSKKTNQ